MIVPLLQGLFEPFPKLALVFTGLQYESFENAMGKGEIGGNEQFLLFQQYFSTHLERFLPFSSNIELLFSATPKVWNAENLMLGKGLMVSAENILV